MTIKKISIAIDGPAGAGKRTVAKIVAEKLAFVYIDSGAMYRALTFKALKNDVSVHDEAALSQMLQHTTIALTASESGQQVLLDEENVTELIRSNEVNANVSAVSAVNGVRTEMVARQAKLGEAGAVVMDGRDIGTVVMPHAEIKVFLFASVEERARRRFEENVSKGIPTDLAKLTKEIADRDHFDSTRKVSPLKKAEDARELDTTHMSIEQVVEKILQLVKEH